MSKESYYQHPPNVSEDKADLIPIDIVARRQEFEENWGEERFQRVIVPNKDGGRTIFEAYRVSFFEDQSLSEMADTLKEFISTVQLLGYRFSTSPMTVPVGVRKTIATSLYFLLERDE